MPSSIPAEEIPATIRAVPDSTNQASSQAFGRSIVLCLDGTGDSYDDDNTSIVKVFQALRKDDPRQLVYYQSGVGTYTSSTKGSLKSGLSAALDMAVGASVGVHIREAYQFLMQNYADNDKISIFGFSRGAYTARALAGMLHKVGLLPANNQAQVAFAYRWYKDDSEKGWQMSADFKRTFCIDVDVHFLGCWDTVASVGVIPRILPFAKTNNTSVRYFRHALALDEHRAKFKANHWLQRHPQTEAQKKAARERQRLEIEHARRSAGAGRGVHRDQQGHVVSYGAFGSINLSDLTRRAESGLDAPDEGASSASTRGNTRRHSMVPERNASLRNGLSSVGRRRSVGSIFAPQDGKSHEGQENGDVPPPASKYDNRPASTFRRRSSVLPGKSDDGTLHEEPDHSLIDDDEGHEQDGDDMAAGQYDKGTSKTKVRKSQQQINLMQAFNAKDEHEWGRTTHETDVLEVWFCGAHADCGSGAVPNSTRHMISRIPLRWMLRQTFMCDTGILYRSDVLAEHGLDVDTLYPRVIERKPDLVGPNPSDIDRYSEGTLPSLERRRQLIRRSNAGSETMSSITSTVSPRGEQDGGEYFSLEKANSFIRKLGPLFSANDGFEQSDGVASQLHLSPSSTAGTITKHSPVLGELDILREVHEDYFDCQASINDQLAASKSWWILEVIPIKYRVKEKDGTWRKKIGPNMGRYRTVREPRPKMHWTVAQRQQLLGYEIKCHLEDDAIWEVVM